MILLDGSYCWIDYDYLCRVLPAGTPILGGAKAEEEGSVCIDSTQMTLTYWQYPADGLAAQKKEVGLDILSLLELCSSCTNVSQMEVAAVLKADLRGIN